MTPPITLHPGDQLVIVQNPAPSRRRKATRRRIARKRAAPPRPSQRMPTKDEIEGYEWAHAQGLPLSHSDSLTTDGPTSWETARAARRGDAAALRRVAAWADARRRAGYSAEVEYGDDEDDDDPPLEENPAPSRRRRVARRAGARRFEVAVAKLETRRDAAIRQGQAAEAALAALPWERRYVERHYTTPAQRAWAQVSELNERIMLARAAMTRGDAASAMEWARPGRVRNPAEAPSPARAAAKACKLARRRVKRENETNLRAEIARGAQREAAADRLCAIGKSAAKRATKAQRAAERAARKAAAPPRPKTPTRRRSAPRVGPPVDPQTGKRLTKDEIEQMIGEARSELGAVEGESGGGVPYLSAAALWFYSPRRLRTMLGAWTRSAPAKRGSERFYEHATQSYYENAGDINARWARAHDRDPVSGQWAEQQRTVDRTAAVIHGAAMPAADAPKRIRAALAARDHLVGKGKGKRITCRLCGGRGVLEPTRRGALSFRPLDERLAAARCTGEAAPF